MAASRCPDVRPGRRDQRWPSRVATGPIASVLIEEEIHNLGYEVDQFPAYRARDLVGRLAVEIRREEKKSIFIKNMVSKIRQKRYP